MLNRIFKQDASSYKPKDYWSKAGRVPDNEILKIQGKTIVEHLLKIDFKSVFELGPGEGRITKPILENKDIEYYDAVDYTPLRIEIIREKLKNYLNFNVQYGNFQEIDIDKKYDLVLASEVLMHIKPNDLKDVMKKMVNISNKYIINIDYWESNNSIKLANHNFIHDYGKIYDELGVKYTKIDLDYKQSIFIAR